MLESNSERKWKEEEHLEPWVWAGALVVGWFSTPGSLQSGLAFLLLSRCPEVFPSIPDFALGMGLCTVRIRGLEEGQTAELLWRQLQLQHSQPRVFQIFRFYQPSGNAGVQKQLSVFGKVWQRRVTQRKGSLGTLLCLTGGFVFQSVLWVQVELANLLLFEI